MPDRSQPSLSKPLRAIREEVRCTCGRLLHRRLEWVGPAYRTFYVDLETGEWVIECPTCSMPTHRMEQTRP